MTSAIVILSEGVAVIIGPPQKAILWGIRENLGLFLLSKENMAYDNKKMV